jgi:hypothetical protein
MIAVKAYLVEKPITTYNFTAIILNNVGVV